MLKQFLLTLTGLQLVFAGSAAQLSATLQSGDKVTPFYGANALVEAYESAVNGDVITLSPGNFNSTNIEKQISIIGTYAFSGQAYESTILNSLTISGSNVSIEGIRGSIIIKGSENLLLKRSYFNYISDVENEGNKYHNNTTLSECMIGNFGAMEFSNNIVIRNCLINYFSDTNEVDRKAYIYNCRVNLIACISECIIGSGSYQTISRSLAPLYKMPYGIYTNNYLGIECNLEDGLKITHFELPSPSEFKDNYFMTYFETGKTTEAACRLSCDGENIDANNLRGLYSTPLGKNSSPSFLLSDFGAFKYSDKEYGPIGPKFNPSIPAITSSEIDTETDAEGKLHVKITAEARD